jgi:GST-like protein
LAGKTGRLLPADPRQRSVALQWLTWQVASLGPMGGQAAHFLRYAPERIDYAIERYTAESARLTRILERRLGEADYLAGDDYSIADIAVWPWYGGLAKGALYGAGEFLDVGSYKNLLRWTDQIAERPAVQRGRMVNAAWGDPAKQLWERHEASDFETKTADKAAAEAA